MAVISLGIRYRKVSDVKCKTNTWGEGVKMMQCETSFTVLTMCPKCHCQGFAA